MPMSGDRSRHRITVLRTRRDWSPSEKRRILAEMAAPGANVSSIARRHGVAQSLIYRWRKDAVAAEARDARLTFVPVAIEAPALLAAPTAPLPAVPDSSPKSASAIEVMLANGRAVRVGADIDTAALVRIVAALEKPE